MDGPAKYCEYYLIDYLMGTKGLVHTRETPETSEKAMFRRHTGSSPVL